MLLTEENDTKSASGRCSIILKRAHVPYTFGQNIHSKVSTFSLVIQCSSITFQCCSRLPLPAKWNTPLTCCPPRASACSTQARSLSRSETSTAQYRNSPPDFSSAMMFLTRLPVTHPALFHVTL